MNNNDTREILPGSASVFLSEDTKADMPPVEFKINEFYGSGSSVLCYNATCLSNGKTGTLKELYPRDFDEDVRYSFNLHRRNSADPAENLQVYCKPSCRESFFRAREDYIFSYRKIYNAKELNSDLNDYIPTFEIYKGIADKSDPDNYTYYVWTPNDPRIISFDKYISSVAENAAEGKTNMSDLKTILTAILDLTRCIKSLHCIQLLHLDIKPSNFGIRLHDKKPKNNISLFDINSVFSIDGYLPPTTGTPGFNAPEVRNCITDNISQKSDIYSIGATLFNAIAIKNGKNMIYSDSDHENIPFIIAESELFDSTDETENVILKKQITDILKKCLNRSERNKCYTRATPLAEDLEEAIRTLDFIKGKSSLSRGSQIAITEFANKEDILDSKIPTGSTGAIQWLLYKEPLYRYAENGEINILVLGAGTYASKFMDLALEMSQIKDCYANITVAGNDIEKSKDTYLEMRPELGSFTEIDGVRPDKTPEAYGSVEFLPAVFSETNRSVNRKALADICAMASKKNFSYIFIALHGDKLNYAVMKTCCEYFKRRHVLISFVIFGDTEENSRKKAISFRQSDFADYDRLKICPVDVHDTLIKHKDYATLKQIAFNTHLLWTNTIEDLQKSKADFMKKYNFDSSVSSALSVKYKLHSFTKQYNTELPEDILSEPIVCASKINELLNDGSSESAEIISELVMYEHRRWIISMTTKSWRTLDDLSSLTVSTRDDKNKRHPCIVHSGKNGIFAGLGNEEKQRLLDGGTVGGSAAADKLDMVSINMHRHFAELAKNIKISDFADNIKAINEILKDDTELKNSFGTYVSALNRLLCDNRIRTYSYYLSFIEKAFGNSPRIADKKELFDNFEAIKRKIYPKIEACAYKDLKANDISLIKSIPFIMSYSPSMHITVPFTERIPEEEESFSTLKNTAAAMILNPATVTYLIDASAINADEAFFADSLTDAIGVMECHNLQCKINLVILQPDTDIGLSLKTKKELSNLSFRIKTVSVLDYIKDDDGENSDLAVLSKYVNGLIGGKSGNACIAERNNTGISAVLDKCGGLPRFSIDTETGMINADDECKYIEFMPESMRPHINTEDLLCIYGKEYKNLEPEMQNDYAFFWSVFNKNRGAWESLCKKMFSHCNKHDHLATVKKPSGASDTLCEYDCFLPEYAKPGIKKLLASGAFAEGSYIEDHSLSSVKLHGVISKDCLRKLPQILSMPQNLINSSQIIITPLSNDRIKILYDDLNIADIDINNDEAAILSDLAKAGYLINYRRTNGKASFCCSTGKIKKMLSDIWYIYAVYAYYTTPESGRYDEVRMVSDLNDTNDDSDDESALIFIKGFRSAVIDRKKIGTLKKLCKT